MTEWLPLQRSFLVFFRFLSQICEFSQLPRPGFWRGGGAASAWDDLVPRGRLGCQTMILK